MNDRDGVFMTTGVFVGLLAGVVLMIFGSRNFEDFVKSHAKDNPFCIERQVGQENIKRCYFAKEVTCVKEELAGFYRQACEATK